MSTNPTLLQEISLMRWNDFMSYLNSRYPLDRSNLIKNYQVCNVDYQIDG